MSNKQLEVCQLCAYSTSRRYMWSSVKRTVSPQYSHIQRDHRRSMTLEPVRVRDGTINIASACMYKYQYRGGLGTMESNRHLLRAFGLIIGLIKLTRVNYYIIASLRKTILRTRELS